MAHLDEQDGDRFDPDISEWEKVPVDGEDDPGDEHFWLFRLNLSSRPDALARELDGRFTRYATDRALLTREEAEAWGQRISDPFVIIPVEPRLMRAVDDNRYESADGWVMAREDGRTPEGNDFAHRWVLRDDNGAYIGYDQYRFDMEGRWNLRLERN